MKLEPVLLHSNRQGSTLPSVNSYFQSVMLRSVSATSSSLVLKDTSQDSDIEINTAKDSDMLGKDRGSGHSCSEWSPIPGTLSSKGKLSDALTKRLMGVCICKSKSATLLVKEIGEKYTRGAPLE